MEKVYRNTDDEIIEQLIEERRSFEVCNLEFKDIFKSVINFKKKVEKRDFSNDAGENDPIRIIEKLFEEQGFKVKVYTKHRVAICILLLLLNFKLGILSLVILLAHNIFTMDADVAIYRDIANRRIGVVFKEDSSVKNEMHWVKEIKDSKLFKKLQYRIKYELNKLLNK